jgi:hypothetical protein
VKKCLKYYGRLELKMFRYRCSIQYELLRIQSNEGLINNSATGTITAVASLLLSSVLLFVYIARHMIRTYVYMYVCMDFSNL